MNDFCGRCGTCKSRILNSYRLIYDKIIYIGDGYSDFCPSRHADVVFAKKVLYQRCEQEGTPCMPFDDFGEINNYLKKNY
jgi:2-hydroxy-3-keto-5-methylthiopentenyl-1-phosphate phosphatase